MMFAAHSLLCGDGMSDVRGRYASRLGLPVRGNSCLLNERHDVAHPNAVSDLAHWLTVEKGGSLIVFRFFLYGGAWTGVKSCVSGLRSMWWDVEPAGWLN